MHLTAEWYAGQICFQFAHIYCNIEYGLNFDKKNVLCFKKTYERRCSARRNISTVKYITAKYKCTILVRNTPDTRGSIGLLSA